VDVDIAIAEPTKALVSRERCDPAQQHRRSAFSGAQHIVGEVKDQRRLSDSRVIVSLDGVHGV